ncbi:MAG TPA: sodium:proton antiporter [Nocardioidaceae bacterium]|jgi:NhaP-type Na+/H+ or K+/H+ antiporter|nr:sodium:proton antiporter [Nocardioidaceae bacterium]
MGDLLGAAAHDLQTMSPAAYLALIVVVGVLGQWLAWRLRVPSILVLLLVGFGLGQVAEPDRVLGRDVLFAGVTITVGIILFESSMSLRIRQVRDLGRPVIRLCTVTVLIAWALITFSALAVGFALEVALLVGAILVVTGPTVIAPILRTLRPTRRISSLLRWEGIVVDPIGAVLGLLVFQGVLAGGLGDALPTVLLSLVKTVVIGFGIALALGYLLDFLMRRHAIPDFLHGVVFLAAAVGALMVSNGLQPESGLLTVTVLGVFLGNRPGLHLEHVQEFKEHLQVLFVGSLFVVLAGRISPAELWDVLPQALVFLGLLIVVVRPVSVLLGLIGTKVTRAERTLMACMAPRGIVAAAVTSIFALEFSRAAQTMAQRAHTGGPGSAGLDAQAHELATLSQQVERMVPLVFLVIVCTVALYGFGVGRLAERLGLASTSPQGILFAGVNPWTVDAARLLRELGVPTMIVAREYVDLSRAKMAGLQTVTANVLSEYVVKDLDLSGIGSLVACTSDDEHNATAAREFIHDLGRAHVFQLRRADSDEPTAHERTVAAGHLSGRFAFVPALTHRQLRERSEALQVRRTDLTKEFTLTDFQARYDGQAVVMFVCKDGRTTVANEETKLPERDATLIAMVPD